jgi:nucleotide-binding universal stress UspA family protein
MLGSVSRSVLRSAKCSVLVVKGNDTVATPEATTPPLRALAAYDLEHDAEAMANMLKQFSWPPDAEGYVITVVRPMFLAELPDWVKSRPRDPDVAAMADAWRKEHQQNLLAARQELEQFRAMLPPCFPRNESIVAEGRPAEQIIKTAQDNKVDLVVLGSGDAGRLERLLVGSTSEQVLASGTSSVLIVR